MAGVEVFQDLVHILGGLVVYLQFACLRLLEMTSEGPLEVFRSSAQDTFVSAPNLVAHDDFDIGKEAAAEKLSARLLHQSES